MSLAPRDHRAVCYMPSWSTMAFLKAMLSPYWLYLSGMALVMVAWAIQEAVVRPSVIKLILDAMNRCEGGVGGSLVFYGVVYSICSFATTWLFRLYDWLTLHTAPALRARVANTLTEYVLGHSHAYYQNNFAGALSTSITSVADAVPRVVEILLERFMSSSLRVSLALVTLWVTVPKVACVTGLWAVLFIAGVYALSRRIRTLAEIAAGQRAQVTGAIVDVVSNGSTVRLFCGKAYEQRLLQHVLHACRDAERTRDWSLLWLSLYQGTLFALLEAMTLWLLITGFMHGTVTAGDAALVFSINLSLINALWGLSQDGAKMIRFWGEISQGLRILTVPHGIVNAATARELTVSSGEIRFEKVNFSYLAHDIFFTDLSLTIPGGQKVGLVGYSGSGKSTFVNLVLRLFEVESGQIYIDGQDIAEITQESLRGAIALIPQEPILFHRSLYDNILYGRLTATTQELLEASKRAHAHDFITELPEKYDTLVGERGVKLSGGQRQRIAIARAFLKNAPILIMDEATSALDSITEQAVQEGLESLMHRCTTLVIAHRLSTLLKMDRILVFDKGVVVEDGTHEELLAQQGTYHRLWMAQVGGFLPEQRG